MKQNNIQRVYFCAGGQWYTKEISLKHVYTRVHAEKEDYAMFGMDLAEEMMLNILYLAKQGMVDLNGLIITDYGCGKAAASNAVGAALAGECVGNLISSGATLEEVMAFVRPMIVAPEKVPAQIEHYGFITVQRYDIGVPRYSHPLEQKADVVFCNDVFEHIPSQDITAFIASLEDAGKYIFASISLRDAVNYVTFTEKELLEGAEVVTKPGENGIVLEKDNTGNFIFSLHVSVFTEAKWKGLLGHNWSLLPAQDYTAVSAVNFTPGEDYRSLKMAEIMKAGFADFIPWPTPIGSSYEGEPTLFMRTAKMQAFKHQRKLEVLKSYPDCEFKFTEGGISEAWLRFIGNDENSLKRLYALDEIAKKDGGDDAAVAAKAVKLLVDYVCGDKKAIDEWVATH